MVKGQNTSSAVMAQRHASRDEYDYYPTPPWGTRALCRFLHTRFYEGLENLADMTAEEPACGEGFMARPLSEYFKTVRATDIQDFSKTFPAQDGVEDFLLDWGGTAPRPDWVITNPPFVQGQAFVEQALRRAKRGVAMLVRLAFLETIDRYNELLKPHPPAAILIFIERLPIHKGRLTKEAGTATSYCWIIWDCENTDSPARDPNLGVPFHSLAPGTRAQCERDDDYPAWAAELAPAPLLDGVLS